MRCFVSITMIALALAATPAQAQDAIEPQAAPCAACHGADGRPSDPTIPIIWGQQADYLAKQLRDYRNGDRDSQIMSSMAESVKEADIPALARYFSSKSWPRPAVGQGDEAGAGVARTTLASAQCEQCHGAGLVGGKIGDQVAPRLAGQEGGYLTETMKDFKSHQRSNDATMSALLQPLAATQIEALAKYLASL
jgi:cytochrome c553